MRGSPEWCEMMLQELQELRKMASRKVDSSEIAEYVAAYRTEKSSPSSPSKDVPQLGYRFGQDLTADFTTLFSAFNRVAKQKLDTSNLAYFASTAFLDSLYQQQSVEFSAELTGSCALYYRLFDEKIEHMRQRMQEFRDTVAVRLAEINSRTRRLGSLVRKLLTSAGGRVPAAYPSSRFSTSRSLSTSMRPMTPSDELVFSFAKRDLAEREFANSQRPRIRK